MVSDIPGDGGGGGEKEEDGGGDRGDGGKKEEDQMILYGFIFQSRPHCANEGPLNEIYVKRISFGSGCHYGTLPQARIMKLVALSVLGCVSVPSSRNSSSHDFSR